MYREKELVMEITFTLCYANGYCSVYPFKKNVRDYVSCLQSQEMWDSVLMLRRMFHVFQFINTSSLKNRGVWFISPETHRECHSP